MVMIKHKIELVHQDPLGFGELKTKRHQEQLGRSFKKRDAPCKACFHCSAVQPNGTRICPSCGHEHFEKISKPSPFKGKPNGGRPKADDPRYSK